MAAYVFLGTCVTATHTRQGRETMAVLNDLTQNVLYPKPLV